MTRDEILARCPGCGFDGTPDPDRPITGTVIMSGGHFVFYPYCHRLMRPVKGE